MSAFPREDWEFCAATVLGEESGGMLDLFRNSLLGNVLLVFHFEIQ